MPSAKTTTTARNGSKFSVTTQSKKVCRQMTQRVNNWKIKQIRFYLSYTIDFEIRWGYLNTGMILYLSVTSTTQKSYTMFRHHLFPIQPDLRKSVCL